MLQRATRSQESSQADVPNGLWQGDTAQSATIFPVYSLWHEVRRREDLQSDVSGTARADSPSVDLVAEPSCQ